MDKKKLENCDDRKVAIHLRLRALKLLSDQLGTFQRTYRGAKRLRAQYQRLRDDFRRMVQ